MANEKTAVERTTHRLVTYLNDKDFEDFMMVLADRHMVTTHYLRLLLTQHLQALRDNNLLVAPEEKEDEDL